MRYFQTIHPFGLTPVVKKITIITEDNPNPKVNAIKYFADGLPGIMFHQSCAEILLNEEKLSEFFLYGQTVQPIEISTRGPFQAIVFHLYPHVTKSLFGMDAHELRDTCIACELLHFKEIAELKDKLLATEDKHAQIELMAKSLQALLSKMDVASPADLHFATQTISQQGGAISLTTLHKTLKISERTFERKFLQHVGVTPRLFKRICKFQAALQQLESNDFHVLTDVAYAHEFADQSHFIRTFKEFTGYTPKEYLLQFTQA